MIKFIIQNIFLVLIALFFSSENLFSDLRKCYKFYQEDLKNLRRLKNFNIQNTPKYGIPFMEIIGKKSPRVPIMFDLYSVLMSTMIVKIIFR